MEISRDMEVALTRPCSEIRAVLFAHTMYIPRGINRHRLKTLSRLHGIMIRLFPVTLNKR